MKLCSIFFFQRTEDLLASKYPSTLCKNKLYEAGKYVNM